MIHLHSLMIILCCSAFLSCINYDNAPVEELILPSVNDGLSGLLDNHREWINAISQKDTTLKYQYDHDAISIVDGELISLDDYLLHWMNLKPDTVRQLISIEAVPDSEYVYEISAVQTEDRKEIGLFTIWHKDDGGLVRQLEFIASSSTSAIDTTILTNRRKEWMKFCNAHDVDRLVTELYANDAIYFNHKPPVIGHKAIIEEYDYMRSPDYSLTLRPIVVHMVSDEIAYEIGQCDGGYQGKYVLVWQKNIDGAWTIAMDSNI